MRLIYLFTLQPGFSCPVIGKAFGACPFISLRIGIILCRIGNDTGFAPSADGIVAFCWMAGRTGCRCCRYESGLFLAVQPSCCSFFGCKCFGTNAAEMCRILCIFLLFCKNAGFMAGTNCIKLHDSILIRAGICIYRKTVLLLYHIIKNLFSVEH